MSQLFVNTIATANGSTDLVIKTGNVSGVSLIFGANGALSINTPAILNSGNGQFYGNSTSNTTVNTSIIQIANSTIQANVNPTSLKFGANLSLTTTGLTSGNLTANVSMNTTSISVGANVLVTASSIAIGNSTVNTMLTATGLLVNGAALSTTSTLVANNTDNQTYYLPMTNTTSGLWSNAVISNSQLTFNPSTDALTLGNSSVYTQITNLGIILTNAYNLWSWGYNSTGALGDGTTSNRSSPVTTAGGGATWSQISMGYAHIAAIKTDGTLWTCGYNTKGQLGNGTTTNSSSPGTTAGGGTTWSKVASGWHGTAAIKTDGTLWTWGNNQYGQLGDGTTTSRSSPGTTAGGGTTWSQVSISYQHTAAIKTDGTLWTWGYDSYGQLGDGTTTSRSSPGTIAGGGTNWSQVSCVFRHTAAIKTDGTLWTWGDNQYGQLGNGTTTNRSSPGTTIGGGTTWSQVACGYRHTAAIKTDGTLWTWGNNQYGQLGEGTTTSRSSPGTTIGGGTTWLQVSSQQNTLAAIKTDGTLWTCGYGGQGALGDNTTSSRSSLVTIAGGGTAWSRVACGVYSMTAISQTSRQL